MNDIWIGDGQPEEPVYRLEPVFHYLATGQKWQGSSMYLWKDSLAVDFFKNELIPKLEKAIPGCTASGFQWTRKAMKQLCDIYCETYLSKNIRPIAWTMYLSPYTIAEMPNVVTVASKGGDARLLALQRGVARQSGGGKFMLSWRGGEPTTRYAYRKSSLYNFPDRGNWGYPLPHLKYYIFRPYLLGLNYYMNEGFPESLIHDMDGNGTFQLTELGRITKDLMDYANRVPERGTVYTPVALVQGWDRADEWHYRGKIAFDNADWMNYALINDLLLPEHRHSKNTGEYSLTPPFGEIMDLLQPNPNKPVDSKIFDGYKVLVLMGGITLSEQYKTTLLDYVRNGGILVVNAADVKNTFEQGFTGVNIGSIFKSDKVRNELTGKTFNEKQFNCYELGLNGAQALYSCNGKPVVTANAYGKGQVIVTAPEYMLTTEKSVTMEGRRKQQMTRPMLLTFWTDFFDSLFASVSPFEVRVRPEDKPDISWSICKKGDKWTLALYNYSLKREELVQNSVGTACVTANYPYKAVPVEIVCRFPAEDVVELFEGREVKIQKIDGYTHIRLMCSGGDIGIYEFSPTRTPLPVFTRYVNFALNKPVTVSSTLKGYSAEYAVDGKESNGSFWQSGEQKKVFSTPQWLTVDLQQPELIDHVKLIFHTWEQRDVELRQSVYKYQVQISMDGNDWKPVIDESRNESPAHPGGTETWFKPVQARYVKLLVLHNPSNSGAQVVEFAVMGGKTEQYAPKRKLARAQLTQLLPEYISSAPDKKKVYLTKLEPLSVKPGWMPNEKQWKELNGSVKLYCGGDLSGELECPESLYGESVFEAVYPIPSDAKYFAAVCGFGNRDSQASVEFKVYVDDQLKSDSGVYRPIQTPFPVAINIEGGKKLKLITTDAGDGINGDYAWWGDARFILK
ncbi:MAG: discoidin domain-containing protein [Lentisphaerota bacterium]